MKKKDSEEKITNEELIEQATERLQKKYGDNVLIQMDKNIDFKVEMIPTGCFSLDEALGGGLARGRLCECFGEPSSGKSSLTLFLMAQIQKRGGKVALIDAEYAFDSEFAKKIGVDISKLMVSQPTTLEECMDVLRELVETKAFDLIVIDSLAGLVPKSEVEGEEMLKDTMAVIARLMSKSLRILSGPISRSKTSVIFINQTRSKIGVFYGSKTTTGGGISLKFFSSVRMDVKRGDKILGNGEEQIGNWMDVTMVKNKVAPPFRKASFELYYAKGIDLYGDALDYGEKVGVIKKTGNTYSFNGKDIGVGRDKAKKIISEDPKLFEEIKKAINEVIKTNATK